MGQQGTHISLGVAGVGQCSKSYMASNQADTRCGRTYREGGWEGETRGPGPGMEESGSGDCPSPEENGVVEVAECFSTGEEELGKASSWTSSSVGEKELASERVERILSARGKSRWAPKTRESMREH